MSLMSVMVMETEVVAVLPELIPLKSWALTTTTYWLLVSRSRLLTLQLITPARWRQTDDWLELTASRKLQQCCCRTR